MQITSLHSLNAFLLPIKTVGVQVNEFIPGIFLKLLPSSWQAARKCKNCYRDVDFLFLEFLSTSKGCDAYVMCQLW